VEASKIDEVVGELDQERKDPYSVRRLENEFEEAKNHKK